jgi:hypothetical protein
VYFEINGVSTVIHWGGATPTGPSWYPIYQTVVKAAAAQDWGATDLFPTYGMPAFSILLPIPIPFSDPRPPIKLEMASNLLPQVGPRKNM